MLKVNAARIMIPLPQEAFELMQRVYDSRHEIYAVGGFVRDFFLGRKGGDVDFTTDLLPDEIKSLFSDCRFVEAGIKHGTVTVIFKGIPFEVTTYRCDGEYLDARHPKSVSFGATLEQDLARRDFTMNAVCCFQNKENYGVVDLFGGIEDINKGIIKAIGNPQKRFEEDALRILRGYRFSAQLGFSFETDTKRAAIEAAPLLKKVSFERKLFELFAILRCNESSVINELYQDGVLYCIMNNAFCPSALDISCILKAENPILRQALLFLNASTDTLAALPLDRQTKSIVSLIKKEGGARFENDKSQLKKRLFSIGREGALILLDYQAAIGAVECPDEIKALLDEIFINDECYALKQLRISGDDVRECFPEIKGEQVGKLLKELLFAVIDGQLKNQKEELVEFLNSKMK